MGTVCLDTQERMADTPEQSAGEMAVGAGAERAGPAVEGRKSTVCCYDTMRLALSKMEDRTRERRTAMGEAAAEVEDMDGAMFILYRVHSVKWERNRRREVFRCSLTRSSEGAAGGFDNCDRSGEEIKMERKYELVVKERAVDVSVGVVPAAWGEGKPGGHAEPGGPGGRGGRRAGGVGGGADRSRPGPGRGLGGPGRGAGGDSGLHCRKGAGGNGWDSGIIITLCT